jgi:hypothetical protein
MPQLNSLAIAVLLVCACDTKGQSAGGGGARANAIDVPAAPTSLALKLTTVAQAADPVALVARPCVLAQPGVPAQAGGATRPCDDALYIVEKRGRIRALRNGAVADTPVLDLSKAVSEGSEQGLLGLAFSRDGAKLYVNYTDLKGDTRIVEYAMGDGVADAATARPLLKVEQPFRNHNGGHVVLGPDGMLWIGLGDGGSGGDPGNRGQDLTTLLGKMLRIDPAPSATGPYSIPSDNPFAKSSAGKHTARPEIWAYGLRNPWRYSFDRDTGDLWIADVGQNKWEEIDFVPGAGRSSAAHGAARGAADGAAKAVNFGWARLEGTHSFNGEAPEGAVPPIHEYSHAEKACSVTGGNVYRGKRIPSLVGTYLFSDFCAGEIYGLRQRDGRRTELVDLGLKMQAVASFGEDSLGEIYVVSLTGVVARIAPLAARGPGDPLDR